MEKVETTDPDLSRTTLLFNIYFASLRSSCQSSKIDVDCSATSCDLIHPLVPTEALAMQGRVVDGT